MAVILNNFTLKKNPRFATLSIYVFDVDRARQINLVFSKKN